MLTKWRVTYPAYNFINDKYNIRASRINKLFDVCLKEDSGEREGQVARVFFDRVREVSGGRGEVEESVQHSYMYTMECFNSEQQ